MASILSKHILQIHNLRSVLEQGGSGSIASELKKNQIAIAQNGSINRLAFRDNSGVFTDVANLSDTIDGAALPIYSNNSTAILGGLGVGDFYRTGANPDVVCVVH